MVTSQTRHVKLVLRYRTYTALQGVKTLKADATLHRSTGGSEPHGKALPYYGVFHAVTACKVAKMKGTLIRSAGVSQYTMSKRYRITKCTMLLQGVRCTMDPGFRWYPSFSS